MTDSETGSWDSEAELHGPDRTDIDRTQRLLGARYELCWILGRGGMSTVWLAWDSELGRDVAVKVLKPEYTDSPEFRARFRNESRAAEALNSRNVVTTLDAREVYLDGATFCYLVMEYVRGETLADVLRRELSLEEDRALDVLAQTAAGLSAIHAAGMVHRDIKPANLLITDEGVVKVTDFGIAKAAEAVPLTQTGLVVGTAQYVSPEQAQGRRVSSASDVYSLGVVGYEMLAGRRPFTGDSSVSVAIKHITDPPAPLPAHVSPQFRELIGICLRKEAARRYADGAELAGAIAAVAGGRRPPRPAAVPETEALHAQTEHLHRAAPPLDPQTGYPTGLSPAAGAAAGVAAGRPFPTDAHQAQRPETRGAGFPGGAQPPMQGQSRAQVQRPARGPVPGQSRGPLQSRGPGQPPAPRPATGESTGRAPAGTQRNSSPALWIALLVAALLGLGVAAYLLTGGLGGDGGGSTTASRSVTTTAPSVEEDAPSVPIAPQRTVEAPTSAPATETSSEAPTTAAPSPGPAGGGAQTPAPATGGAAPAAPARPSSGAGTGAGTGGGAETGAGTGANGGAGGTVPGTGANAGPVVTPGAGALRIPLTRPLETAQGQ